MSNTEPTFTQKHYEHLMRELAKERADAGTVETLCRIFTRDNPKFNRSKFINGAMQWTTSSKSATA